MTSKLPPYILQELPDITESIKFPLKSVQRIKVSHSFIFISLAIFQKETNGALVAVSNVYIQRPVLYSNFNTITIIQ